VTLRAVLRWNVRLLLPALVLVTSTCDTFPGIDAIGVQRGPGGKIEVVKPLCPGDRVTEVSLIRAPEGHLDDSESGVPWQITSKTGSTQDRYGVGPCRLDSWKRFPCRGCPEKPKGSRQRSIANSTLGHSSRSYGVNFDRTRYLSRTGTSLLASSRLVTKIAASTRTAASN
jgi:hypothetical protein